MSFLKIKTFGIAFYKFNLSTGSLLETIIGNNNETKRRHLEYSSLCSGIFFDIFDIALAAFLYISSLLHVVHTWPLPNAHFYPQDRPFQTHH